MSTGKSVLLRVEIGVPVRASRPANAVLSRIAPAPRRPASRIPVRWTLSQRVRHVAAIEPMSA